MLQIKNESLFKKVLYGYSKAWDRNCHNCPIKEECTVQAWTLSLTECDEYLFMKLTGGTIDDYGKIEIN